LPKQLPLMSQDDLVTQFELERLPYQYCKGLSLK